MEVRKLLAILVAGVAGFAVLTWQVSPAEVFHCMDAMSIAAGVMVMVAFAPALLDAWQNRRATVTPAHLLAIAIVINWAGFVIRLGRWYFTDASPVNDDLLMQWTYNVGLWITTAAAFLLVWAVAVTDDAWTKARTLTLLTLFAVTTAVLMVVDSLY